LETRVANPVGNYSFQLVRLVGCGLNEQNFENEDY